MGRHFQDKIKARQTDKEDIVTIEARPEEEKTTPKTWTDQPDAVAGLTIVASLALRNCARLEVRRGNHSPEFSVTVGSLFGSQTEFADNADGLVELLGRVTSE